MKLKKLILASLLVIQSTNSFAQNEELPQYLKSPQIIEAQDGELSLLPEDQSKIAKAIIDLEECQAVSKIQKQRYADLEKSYLQSDVWWEQPEFFVSGFVVSFSFGALMVATKCFGICPNL